MSDELSTIQKIRQDIDELILQLSLGKKEAADFLEEQKGRFQAVVDDTKGRVTENAGIDEEKTAKIRQKLDELRLQVELGKLEGRDVFEGNRDKIRDTISAVQKDLDPLKEQAGDLVGEISEAFRIGAESFKAQLDAFALNAGFGSIIAEEEAKLKKEEVEARLKESAERLKPAVEDAKVKIQEAAAEAKEAMEGIRANLSELFKK